MAHWGAQARDLLGLTGLMLSMLILSTPTLAVTQIGGGAEGSGTPWALVAIVFALIVSAGFFIATAVRG